MSAHTVARALLGVLGLIMCCIFFASHKHLNGEQDKLSILIPVQTQLSLPGLAIRSQETTKALGA